MHRRSHALVALALGTIASVVAVSGCDSGYRVGAQQWETDLTAIRRDFDVAEIGLTTGAGQTLASPTAAAPVTSALQNAQAKIAALQGKLPSSGPEYHQDLVAGLADLDDAVKLGLEGLAAKDRNKLQQFGVKAKSGKDRLAKWETAVRGG